MPLIPRLLRTSWLPRLCWPAAGKVLAASSTVHWSRQSCRGRVGVDCALLTAACPWGLPLRAAVGYRTSRAMLLTGRTLRSSKSRESHRCASDGTRRQKIDRVGTGFASLDDAFAATQRSFAQVKATTLTLLTLVGHELPVRRVRRLLRVPVTQRVQEGV